LSEQSGELEARGVDLHLMKRALQSTHYEYAKECFKAVMDGYIKSVGREAGQKVIDKIDEIEKRGRYVSKRE
jgi:TP53 regulating kinase-like protein